MAFPLVLLCSILSVLPLSRAAGQTVVGQLLDGETGAPVEGALVLLEGEEGRDRGGMLTNAQGRFLLRAPSPGRYRVRAERIGYETVRSHLLDLEAGESVPLELRTHPAAIQLDELQVVGEQQCVVRPGEGLEVARVWEEARKALAVQAWTEQEGLYRFRLARWERDMDPNTRLVSSESRQVWEAYNRNPIRSLPVEDLLGEGFVRPAEDGGFYFYGPDAAVLLSDPFLDTHCFRLRNSGSDPSIVGLAFEPVRRRRATDIEGTLWLDRGTGKLRFMEFTYDWAPWPEISRVAQGRVEFEEMPNGAWIVRTWWIRMPRIGLQMGMSRSGDSGHRLVGIREVGGEVLSASSPGRTVLEERPLGELAGVVWDSLHHRPLAGATVFLSGTAFAATSDGAGRFSLVGVPENTYRATFSHPLLDSLGVYPGGAEVTVVADATAEVLLSVPSRTGLLDAVCGGLERGEGEGALMGIVSDRETGAPRAEVTVRAEWSRFTAPGGREILEDIQGLEVTTGPGGRFQLCGIPPGALVRVRASYGGREGPVRQVEVQRNEVVRLDLTVRAPDPGPRPSGPAADPAPPGGSPLS